MRRLADLTITSVVLGLAIVVFYNLFNYQYAYDVTGTIINKKEAFEVTGQSSARSCYLVEVQPDDSEKFNRFVQMVDAETFETKNIGDKITCKRLPKQMIGDKSWTNWHELAFGVSIIIGIAGTVIFLVIMVSYIIDIFNWYSDKVLNYDFSGKKFFWSKDKDTLIIE